MGDAYLLSALDGYVVNFEGNTAFAGAVDFGVGVAFADGRLDLRLTQSVLLGSTNVKGLTLLTMGASF